MKQILQNLRTGAIDLAEVPCPKVRPGHLVVQNTRSLISAGTERMLVEFGRSNLLSKARSQPDKVRQVLEKIRTDGLLPTLETVFRRLDEPLPLGYCSVGRVIEVGEGVDGFEVGDRIATNGPHAEVVRVPATLCARIPDDISDEEACFGTLGTIALHAVRLLEPTYGERVVIVGLGLIGLLAAQLAHAHGCQVLGLETSSARVELARELGIEAQLAATNSTSHVDAFTQGIGADGVLIAASTKSDEVIHESARYCRKRGRIVLLGVVGLGLRRADFYEKELSFRVSCSYGPGRYDADYEDRAQDYPLPYVRWTSGRNLEAVLTAIGRKDLVTSPLISDRVPHADAAQAYERILSGPDTLGIVLEYPSGTSLERIVPLAKSTQLPSRRAGGPLRVGVVGAGNFARAVLLPAIQAAGASIDFIASDTGVTATHAANKFGARLATTDYAKALTDSEAQVVFITTRHDLHSEMVVQALEAGKHVFVEKPLAIDEGGLDRVRRAHSEHPGLQILVGFNRRFAPLTAKLREFLEGRSRPVSAQILVNAGALTREHWLQDRATGGGRLIGEGCHFVDLLQHLIGSKVNSIRASAVPTEDGLSPETLTITLSYADGSIGTLHYWSNGSRAFPKEQVTVFNDGTVLRIDNWRKLEAIGSSRVRHRSRRMDKGHKAEIRAFLDSIRTGGPWLIPFAELAAVTETTLAADRLAVAATRGASLGAVEIPAATPPAGTTTQDDR